MIALLVTFVLFWVPKHDIEDWFRLHPDTYSSRAYPLEQFPAYRTFARDITAHLQTNDRVAIFGSEPELLFYTGLHSVTGYLYAYPFQENQPYHTRMFAEYIREVETAHPEVLIVVANHNSWTGPVLAGSDPVWQWLARYQQSYELVVRHEFPLPLNLTDEERQLLPKEEWVALYRRKS